MISGEESRGSKNDVHGAALIFALGCVNTRDGANAVLQINRAWSGGVKAAYGLQICVTDDKFFTLMGDRRDGGEAAVRGDEVPLP